MATKSALKKYTSYLVYAGVALAIISLLGQFLWDKNIHPLWFILLPFIVCVQWMVFGFVSKYEQHKTSTMLKQYQIAKYAKLFVYMIVLAVYVFAIKEPKDKSMAFLLNFIVYYIVFTVLETWFIHRWLNTVPPTPEKIA